MAYEILSVNYYHITVANAVADGSRLLSLFADAGGNLHAFRSTLVGPQAARFTLFPTDGTTLIQAAERGGWTADGPHAALLIKGGEEAGALSGIYGRLARAGVAVHEANGIADIHGGYGVVLYLDPADRRAALAALQAE